MLTVFVVSDATGDTAQRMIRAALVQFQDAPVRLVRRAHVRTPRQVHAVVHEARDSQAMIIHTLVSDELRRMMRAEARTHGVDALDIMGPILERLDHPPATRPAREARAVPRLDRGEDPRNRGRLVRLPPRRRAERARPGSRGSGVGGRLADHENAHHALLGLSRLVRGQRAAGAGLAAAARPCWTCPRERVFCLTMAPEKLQQLRRVRAEEESIPLHPYASLEQIRAELSYVDELCRKHQWQRIDATGKSVEEVAREIIEWLEEE